jgi:HlyD family secretion protein
MKNKSIFVAISLLVGGMLVAACSAAQGGAGSATQEGDGSAAEAAEAPIAIGDAAVVSEGRLVPRETVELAFVTNGQVQEVLVQEGDVVKAGDILARLSNREQFESNVAAAQLEVKAAQQELLASQQALELLSDDLPEAQTQALEAITQAKDALRAAERRVNGLNSPSDQTDIDQAKATLVLAEDALDKAKEEYEPYADRPETNLVRATLLGKVAQAQAAYDDAARRYNQLRGIVGNDFDLTQAEAELTVAQARLEQAQADFDELQSGPDQDAAALAEVRIDTAEARLQAAEAALAAAEASLADLDLMATIDGTIVDLNLIAGQQVTPGAPVLRLADFSQWYVETDNLTELEVIDVQPGQKATVVADALPDVLLSGQVESISDVFEEKRGDITYTARILLNEFDPRLRWGMTTVVSFEE